MKWGGGCRKCHCRIKVLREMTLLNFSETCHETRKHACKIFRVGLSDVNGHVFSCSVAWELKDPVLDSRLGWRPFSSGHVQNGSGTHLDACPMGAEG